VSLSTHNPEPKEARVEALADELRIARGNSTWRDNPDRPDDDNCAGAVVLIGAGCSRSAGIPLAGEMAEQCAIDLANSFANGRQKFKNGARAIEWLQKKGHLSKPRSAQSAPSSYYEEIFGRHYKSDVVQRRIIQNAISQGQGKINWAHICLGELVDKHFIHTVLTTNFDQLALRGIVLTGRIPVVADGTEALSRISTRPSTPQLVHLHGSMHNHRTRNSADALRDAGRDPSMQATLHGIFRDTTLLVIVGYAGGEDGIVENLRNAVIAFPNLVIYWVLHGNSISDLRPETREIMTGRNKFYIPGQDADVFFSNIMRRLELLPTWMARPLAPIESRLGTIVPPKNPDIVLALNGYRRDVDHLEGCPSRPMVDETRIERAAMDSIAGRDESVVRDIPSELATTNREAARLLATSLRRLGDAENSRRQLKQSVGYWNAYTALCPEDGEAFLQTGEVLLQLEDYNAALQALRVAVSKDLPRRKVWVDARVRLAEAAIEAEKDGADESNLTAAITGLQDVVRDQTYGPESSKRAEVEDYLSSLYLMRANLKSERSDFDLAIDAACQATSGVWKQMPHSKAVGAYRHLAEAHRDLGYWLESSDPEATVKHLSTAVEIFERVQSAYRGELEDVRSGELIPAGDSTAEEILKIFERMKKLAPNKAS
jgi:tetratricopeptide (TPR) repeat protein